jgi:hypothetical protein
VWSWRWVWRAGCLVAGSTAVIGVMHMPMFRSVLMRVGGCPVARVTPEQVEQAQTRALQTLRGAEPAHARPALGFSFTTTTIDDVRAWARDHHIVCEASRKDSLLKCDAVPVNALTPGGGGTFDEVAFGFRLADHRLLNVTTLSTGLTAREASARFAATAERLSDALGEPPLHSLPAIDWDPHAPVYVTYRYSNYIAELTAMELPGRGVLLREHYVSIT